MTPGEWLVKRYHYAGGDSIVGTFPDEESARDYARERNHETQSLTYHVEPVEAEKMEGWGYVCHRSDIGPGLQ